MTALRDALTRRHGGADASHDRIVERAAPVLETLLAHRSVRAYLPDALPPGTLETLVAAAQSAATSSNLQAWSVVAVEDDARRARLSEWVGGQAHVRVAPLFLVWIADLSRLARTAERLGRRAGANRYLEMFVIAVVDAALAAQNAVVAAESMGLGTVYIGAIRNRPDEVAAELRLPRAAFPVFGLCVGRPDPARPASVKPRLAPGTVLHRETYRAEGEADAVAAYDEAMRAFQRSQRMPEQAWSAQASQRVAGPESLSGRDRLAALLKAQGFDLE